MEFGAGAAAAATMMHIAETYPRHCKTTMELKWIFKPKSKTLTRQPPSSFPVFISTKPSHIDPDHLHHLYRTCNLSGHRFPSSDYESSADARKLRIALYHSAFVVSVFCKPRDADSTDDHQPSSGGIGELLLQRVVEPLSPYNGELVGFGRAVSDMALTASIFDVMVVPSLRGLGIGKMIVQRIVRMLTSRDIYDIAALCSEKERPFFEACGFRDDILGSTTMMYTRTVSACSEPNQMTKTAGRKLLLIPPLKTSLRVPLDPDGKQ